MGKVQIVELLSSGSFKDEAGVVFHEACHALWDSKPKSDLIVLQQDFEKAGGAKAYVEIYESLASALGQGWFNESAFGTSPKSWYGGNPTYNAYGHSLFPLVVEYLTQGKTIDAQFAKLATECFKK